MDDVAKDPMNLVADKPEDRCVLAGPYEELRIYR
jgi:hypothetical protein